MSACTKLAEVRPRSAAALVAAATAVGVRSMPITVKPCAASVNDSSATPHPASSTSLRNLPAAIRAANSGCGSPIFHGGGPSNPPCSRYASSQSMTSDDMVPTYSRLGRPGMHRFVGVHVFAVPAQHFGQRRGPAHAVVLQPAHRGHLPAGSIAAAAGTALDDTQEPLAHLEVDAPAAQPVVGKRQQGIQYQLPR